MPTDRTRVVLVSHAKACGLRCLSPGQFHFRRNILFFCCAWLLLLGVARAEELRTWKDSSGKFELKATFIKDSDGKIYLRSEAGKEMVIPLSKLSQADRDYLSAKPAESPFEVVKPAVKISTTSLVAVSTRLGDQTNLVQGLACREYEGQTYVIANLELAPQNLRSMSAADVPEKFVAMWDRNGKTHAVDLEFVAVDRQRYKWILRGPAKDLPPPAIRDEVAPAISEKQPCQIVGLGMNVPSNSFIQIHAAATVSKVFRSLDNNMPKQFVLSSTKFPGDWGVVINDQGQQMGIVIPKLGSSSTAPTDRNAWPLSAAAFWETPALAGVQIYPISGDSQKIVWEIVVQYTDPLQKVSEPFLIYQSILKDIQNFPAPFWLVLPHLAGTPFDKDVSRIALKAGEPSQQMQHFLEVTESKPIGKVLIGRIEAKNPGHEQRAYAFKCQLAYQPTEVKEPVWLQGCLATINHSTMQTPRFKLNVPDIPGFDGRPVDAPRLKKQE